MEYILVTEQEKLNSYIAEIKNCKYIAMDTEFDRADRYYPKLSLIQICYKEKFAIVIDCLSEDSNGKALDLSALIDIIYNPDIIKIFHSARQDLEIFYYKKGSLPKNIFDTQIAVLLINFAKDLSYDKIVKMLLNVDLDKSSKNSNWLKRPLSKKQLQYAANDALYLFESYQIIIKLLEKNNKLHCLDGLFSNIEDISIYENKLNRDINKLSSDLSLINLPLIYDLLIWREELSKKLDIPRNFTLNLEIIKDISRKTFETKEELKEFLGEEIEESSIEQIFEIIARENRTEMLLDQKINLSKPQTEIYNILKIILSNISANNKIHDSIIASNDDLINFIIHKKDTQVNFMSGWRFEIFGKLVLGFVEGQCSLKIKNNKIILEESTGILPS